MALKLTTVGFSFSRAYGIEFPVSTQPLVNECVGVQEWGGGPPALRLGSIPFLNHYLRYQPSYRHRRQVLPWTRRAVMSPYEIN